MKYTEIKMVFWGLLIIFIDININNFDIVNDAIGYIILIMGLRGLSKYNDKLRNGVAVAALSLIIYVFTLPLSLNTSPGVAQNSSLIGIISTVLSILLVYFILYGLSELASDQPELAIKLKTSFLMYIGISLLILAVFIFPPFFLIAFVLGLAVYIYILYLVNLSYKLLA